MSDRLGDDQASSAGARSDSASRPHRRLRRPRRSTRLFRHLCERPERDPLAIRKAAALEDGGALAEPGDELVGEARLPGPRRADVDESAAVLGLGSLERPLELSERVVAADERSLKPGGQLRWIRDGQKPVGGDGACLPFSSSGGSGSASTRARTSRNVDSASRISPGSACCWSRAALFAASPATKLRSGTRPLPATVPVLIPSRSPGQLRSAARSPRSGARASLASRRRPDGSKRVVLVELGEAEHRHHRVADELRHPAVPVDDRPDALDVFRQDLVEVSGSSRSPSPVEVDDIGEQDRDDPAEALRGLVAEAARRRWSRTAPDPGSARHRPHSCALSESSRCP